MDMLWIWLIVVAIALIIEFISMDLTSIWFAIAGFVCLVLSAFQWNISWEIQLVVFIVLSALLIIFVRKIARKWLLKGEDLKTNIDAFVGKQVAMITTATTDALGSAKINGVVWSVQPNDDSVLSKGEQAEIIRVDGNKLIAKKIAKTQEKSEN